MELIKGGKSKDNNIESISLNLRVLHDIVKIVKPFEGMINDYYSVREKSDKDIEMYWINLAKYWSENASPYLYKVLDKIGGSNTVDYSEYDEDTARYIAVGTSHIDSVRMAFSGIEDMISNMSYPGLLLGYQDLLISLDTLGSDFLSAMKEDPYFAEWWNELMENIDRFLSNGEIDIKEKSDNKDGDSDK